MKQLGPWLAGMCAALSLGVSLNATADETVRFGELNWESGSLITEVLRHVVEKGYGLKTETLPGTTVTLEAALSRNDIQVIGEEWAGRSPVWNAAEAKGQVVALGDIVKGATEGWWVPAYVIKGDPAKGIKPLAPDLRDVADLPKYKDLFRDPEAPGKGRFLNSPSGWTSEVVNGQKLKAYGLTDSYSNFRAGSGAALDAEISSAVKRGKPVLFYYWNPTPLLGRYEFIQLQEPPFDAEAWKTLTDADNPNPRPTRSLASRLSIGVSKAFKDGHPEVASFFEKVDLPLAPLNQALAAMSEEHQEPAAAALQLLRTHPEWLDAWLPADLASKVKGTL
jgi:glycine betaine/proline transport system substrate-binding protein